jgi:hypothetical protein
MKLEVGKKYECLVTGREIEILEIGDKCVFYSLDTDEVDCMRLEVLCSLVKPVDRIEELEPFTAYLEVNLSGWLYIKVKDCGDMGFITRDGRCCIQSFEPMHKATEEWMKHGCKVGTTPVEWRGGTYHITDYGYLGRKDIEAGGIWDFKNFYPISHCDDNNIIRWCSNNSPKIF